MASFHEILFPLDIALKSAGGPQRRTDVVTLGSGVEERNARWAHSRRRYDAGYGVKTFEALSQVVEFFEERRGRLHGFRWRDRLDHSSAAPGVPVTPTDQTIGIGDGVTAAFQLGPRKFPNSFQDSLPMGSFCNFAITSCLSYLRNYIERSRSSGRPAPSRSAAKDAVTAADDLMRLSSLVKLAQGDRLLPMPASGSVCGFRGCLLKRISQVPTTRYQRQSSHALLQYPTMGACARRHARSDAQ